jgi:hypothetical protein
MSGLEASMKLKILAIVALGVVGIGAAFVALGGLPASASATTQYLTGAVTTGDVSEDVAATGTLAATASYGVSFGSPARVAGATTGTSSTTWTTQTVKVAAGDAVQEGQVLATPTTDLRRQLADATTALQRQRSSSRSPGRTGRRRRPPPRSGDDRRVQRRTQVSTPRTRATTARPDQLATLPRRSRHRHHGRIVAGLSAPTGDAIVIDRRRSGHGRCRRDRCRSISVGQLATVTVSAVSSQLTAR